MSDEKKWVIFGTASGGGQLAAWVDPDDMEHGERISVENLTSMLFHPTQGVGCAKMCDKAIVNMSAMAFWIFPPAEIMGLLSRTWDQSKIVPVNGTILNSKPRIPPHD